MRKPSIAVASGRDWQGMPPASLAPPMPPGQNQMRDAQMTDAQSAFSATCRCGKCTFEVTGDPLVIAACHCQGCRRMSASAFSLTAMVPAEAFRVTGGTPVRGGAKGSQLDHRFCLDCMSWMFTRINGMEGVVNIRPTLGSDPAWTQPFIETMAADKLPWVELPVARSYEAFPPPEEFAQVTADFVRHWQGKAG